jgi:hypothetical protein
MLKRSILIGCMAVLVAAVSSCIFDAPEKIGGDPPKPPKELLPLISRTAVLNNIEYAYEKRDITPYDALLNDDFTFFYTDGDVGGGTPVQWPRADEVSSNTGLFAAASSISMDIKWEDGVAWTEITPASAPTEKWYTTTVFYDFTIKVGDTTYVPDTGSKAQFTVRNAGTEAEPHWQLVEFRDLGGPNA